LFFNFLRVRCLPDAGGEYAMRKIIPLPAVYLREAGRQAGVVEQIFCSWLFHSLVPAGYSQPVFMYESYLKQVGLTSEKTCIFFWFWVLPFTKNGIKV